MNTIADYHFGTAEAEHTSDYLWDHVLSLLRVHDAKRVLDLGCGNGAFCARLAEAGFNVTGCDPSIEGIDQARRRELSGAQFERIGVEDDPSDRLGTFDAVVSLEVIEHLFFPRRLPRFAARVLRPGGRLIISTPYHGYLKDLALALTNKWELHHSPLWDGGHIKFWTRSTLTQLLREEGFDVTDFRGVGRLPYLWKSMIVGSRLKEGSIARSFPLESFPR